MNLLKNRTVIGVICIVLSLIICFAVTPLFNQSISEKTEIVRVVKPVKNGEEIQSDMVKQVEVGGYNRSLIHIFRRYGCGVLSAERSKRC